LNENFPAYHLFTAFLASNLSFKFSRQTKKKLVGISHYGHFSNMSTFKVEVTRENFLTPFQELKKTADTYAACADVVQILGMESEILWGISEKLHFRLT
jgi:hypothetical protein